MSLAWQLLADTHQQQLIVSAVVPHSLASLTQLPSTKRPAPSCSQRTQQQHQHLSPLKDTVGLQGASVGHRPRTAGQTTRGGSKIVFDKSVWTRSLELLGASRHSDRSSLRKSITSPTQLESSPPRFVSRAGRGGFGTPPQIRVRSPGIRPGFTNREPGAALGASAGVTRFALSLLQLSCCCDSLS